MEESVGLESHEVVNNIDTSNVILEIAEKTFLTLVNEYLVNQELINKLTIKLSLEDISIISKIISATPDTLNDVEKACNDIIKDGKIDSKDIPQFIVIIQRIYQFIYSSKDIKFDSKKRIEVTSSILKFLIHLLILERKIKINDEQQEEFLKDSDALIDSCVSLLSFSKTIKPKGCLKSIFGK
jgi:hypothetical protein